MAVGLGVGMSLAASAPAFPGPTVFNDQDRSTAVSIRAQEIFPTPSVPVRSGLPRCTKATGSAILPKDDNYGTMGIGFNCTGAPRTTCPYAV
jgi:hypothetical protein